MKNGACLFAALVLLTFCARAAQPPPTSAISPAPSLQFSLPPPKPAAAAPGLVATPVDPAKDLEIRKMMAMTGMQKQMEAIKDRMLTSLRQRQANVPPEFWDNLSRDMDVAKLMDREVPLFDKYYTLEDLKAINAFYASAPGQHMLSVMPQAMAESMRLGQEWGRQAFLRASLQMPDLKHRMNQVPPLAKPAPTPPPVDKALPSSPSTPAPAQRPAPASSEASGVPSGPEAPPVIETAPRPVMNLAPTPVLDTTSQPLMKTTPAPVMGASPSGSSGATSPGSAASSDE